MARWIAALAVVLLLAACTGGVSSNGPIAEYEDGAGTGWSRVVEVGERFADGDPILLVPDGAEVTLIDVIPQIEGDGLAFLGVKMAGPQRPMLAVQYVTGWPPVDPDVPEFLPAIGEQLRGGEPAGGRDFDPGYELFFGFEVVGEGRTTIQGYRVIYEHEGRRYSVVLPHTIAICADPPGMASDPGPLDEGTCAFEETVRRD